MLKRNVCSLNQYKLILKISSAIKLLAIKQQLNKKLFLYANAKRQISLSFNFCFNIILSKLCVND